MIAARIIVWPSERRLEDENGPRSLVPSSTTAWIPELSSTREQGSSDWGFSQRIMRLIRNKAEPVGGWGVGVEGVEGRVP